VIGSTLKNYLVEEMLGKGGMGVVYRALDTKLNRRVAIKVLPPDLVKDEDRRRRFIQEAKAASAVNHPAIAQIYEIEEEGDTTFIVMELVEGSTVHQLVARRELDLSSAVEVGIQVGDALARAHEAGIVHRDIKPDNIMVTKDGHPKILDFGLAKLLDAPPGAGDAAASKLETRAKTQAGMIVGTLAYMSPEQARGLPVDKRSDIFSYGIVLYEMASGKLPFDGASALDTMHAIAYEQPAPVTTIRADLPFSLQKVIDRCLKKKPEERYPDLREAVTDLKGVKREIETGASGGMPVLERVKWWFGGLSTKGMLYVGIGGVVVGGVLVWMLGAGIEKRSPFTIILPIGIGLMMFRRVRNRGQIEVRKFVKKASAIREVRLVTFHKGEFNVVADAPTTRTYVKLNALLTAANARLYRGEPMTMIVRDGADEAATRTLLQSPGVQFVREDRGASSFFRRVRKGA
jgi:predicted Ser/Thr protein kinase